MKRVLDVLLELLEPLGTHSSIDNTVVAAHGDAHELGGLVWLTVGIRSIVGDNTLLSGSNSEDGSLGRVDDGREVVDSEHTKVRDGEGTTLVFIGGELVLTGTGSESLGVTRDGAETLEVSILDDRGNETTISAHSDADVNVVVLADSAIHPGAVDLGDLTKGEGSGLDDEVVDGDLGLGLGVELGANTERGWV